MLTDSKATARDNAAWLERKQDHIAQAREELTKAVDNIVLADRPSHFT